MKYLKIQNNGLLDMRLVSLMGGTTKDNDEYKIGQFGTGLKYTLAYLYRNNLHFKIFIGEQEVKLHTEIELIRDEEFEIICIENNRTSITTKMGHDWKGWMIIRELWCNALDEGGQERGITTNPMGFEGKTTFYIQINEEIQTVIDNWGRYFIHEQEPMWENKDYSIYPGGECLRFYKQGVLIYEKECPAVFNYDIHNAAINELREYRGNISSAVAEALMPADEKVARYFLENVNDDMAESDIDFSWTWLKWGEAWKEVIGSAKVITKNVIKDIQARGIDIDLTGCITIPKNVYKSLTRQFDGIGATRVAAKVGEFYESYDKGTEDRIKQGLTILEHCGYVMHPELKFIYGFFEDKTVNAQISLDKRVVFISNTLLQQPVFKIVAILIEENEHFNTGLTDETRAFQQHFIDLYTRSLLAQHAIEI